MLKINSVRVVRQCCDITCFWPFGFTLRLLSFWPSAALIPGPCSLQRLAFYYLQYVSIIPTAAHFLSGSRDYDNTCFIAATLNLSSWLPAIEESLLGAPMPSLCWSDALWKQVIQDVRTRWNGKYKWSADAV